MIVTYTPADGDTRTWDYRSADLPAAEAEEIEEAVGLTFDEWQAKLLQGGMRARRALLWVMLKRDQADLKFADVSFKVGELTIEFDSEEKAKVRAEVERSKDLSDEDREQIKRLLGAEDEGETDPKAD